jgi:hypothetical protein
MAFGVGRFAALPLCRFAALPLCLSLDCCLDCCLDCSAGEGLGAKMAKDGQEESGDQPRSRSMHTVVPLLLS